MLRNLSINIIAVSWQLLVFNFREGQWEKEKHIVELTQANKVSITETFLCRYLFLIKKKRNNFFFLQTVLTSLILNALAFAKANCGISGVMWTFFLSSSHACLYWC